MRLSREMILLIGSSILLLTSLPKPAYCDDDLFRNVVAPLFSEHCWGCHNTDNREGEFSIESKEAFEARQFVIPGDAKNSKLIHLISPLDGERAEMPQSGDSLTTAQVETIKEWINEGARWPIGFTIESSQPPDFDWWSFKPLRRPPPPTRSTLGEPKSIQTPIDAFIQKKLLENGLKFSPAADKRTLIRRLSFDLKGLPPTYEEIQKFVNDNDPLAYQNLVDEYLASPRYGERWARHWLDVVKYADTCGYDKDKLRNNAWPYRDYVIRSFNDDKPYSQFVQEQIAGDAIYPDTPDGILGLGFLASGPWDFIGHVEVPEAKIDGKVARNMDRDDMLSNTLNAFCSVTIQCARCHDHKFDPFSQKDYYKLQAVFAAVDRAERVYEQDPTIEAKRDKLQSTISGLDATIKKLNKQIELAGGETLKQLDQQISNLKSAPQTTPKPEFGYHSQIESSADVAKWIELQFDQPQPVNQIVLHPAHDDFNSIGAGFGFPVRFKITADGQTIFDQTQSDFPTPISKPVRIPFNGSATKIRIVATQLAPRKNDFIFALGEVEVFHLDQNIAGTATVDALDSIEAPARWQKSNLNDGIWFDLSSSRLNQMEKDRQATVIKLVGQKLVQQLNDSNQRKQELEASLLKLPRGKMVYAAATEFKPEGNFKPTRGQPRPIHFLSRGSVTSPGALLGPGMPKFSDGNEINELGNWDDNEQVSDHQRRAALARWIASGKNPLTWRSIVNRVWHYHFGQGLVDSPNDFGRMGALASHPELLDWLAVEFLENGGSFKKLHRLIVTSSVYQQSSKSNPSATKIDSGNQLLWRMNRRRLSAEEIRDSILMSSSKLDLRMGGPGYYLFALEKTEHSPHFEYHKFDHTDPNSYRRSIYRFIARSQPDPFMNTLDCADSSQSTPARNETQTPLQALTMLNSDFNLVMSQQFSNRLRAITKSPQLQIRHAVRIALGREILPHEETLFQNYENQHGMANLMRVIFNLSEFIFVD